MNMRIPSKIRIVEVGPRDGLQNEIHFLPTKDKILLIEKLVQAGITEIEATSFVHPKWIPNLADAEEVMHGIRKLNAIFFALVPNRRGFERAVKSGVQGITWTLSTTDSHSKSNLNRITEESLNEIEVLIKEANEIGLKSRASVATIFGCPFEGTPKFDRVLWVIDRLAEMSCTRIGLADTIGVANPNQIYEWTKKIIEQYPNIEFELHLHNTFGRGLANVMAGVYAGITSFDSSIGGLGGCPYAPGATGNISTEDVLDMFSSMDIQTGIDMNLLLDCSNLIYESFQKPLDSQTFKARKQRQRTNVQ
jgi:hydroxymethylglutaryl-CoA lyase